MTKDEFIDEIAKGFRAKGGVVEWVEARIMAATVLEEFLSDEAIVYGQPGYTWDQEAAFHLAWEDMENW